MQTIKIILSESGSIAEIKKDFQIYKGAFQNKLINILIPSSILAPSLISQYIDVDGAIHNDSGDGTTYTAVKIGMSYLKRNGSFAVSKNFYLRFIKTLTYNGVEYYLYERMLPQAFTLFAGQGENAPKLTINAVNIQNDYLAEGEITVGEGLSDLTINQVTWASVIDTLATYEFIYNTFAASWQLESENVNLATYGITVTGTPANNDKLSIEYKSEQKTLSIITSQLCSLDVLPSTSLDEDEVIEPSELENINGQINDIYTKFADISNDLFYLDERMDAAETNITTNTENISQNTNDIAYLYQHLAMSEFYIGTMQGSTLPTTNQLDDFVDSTVQRLPQNSDVIIFILEIEGELNKNYKYIFSAGGWAYYEIPPLEEAGNGSLGIIEGTYNVGLTNNTLVDIAGGKILNIYVKNTLGSYSNIRDYINSVHTNYLNIIFGNTVVGEALKATQDALGNDIVNTYLTKTAGATKQFVRDYAMPRLFNDVYYIATTGLEKEIPTTPVSGIQFTKNTSSVGSYEIFTVTSESEAEYELSKNNNCSNNIWITSDVDKIVEFRLTTKVKHVADVDYTNLAIELSNTIDLTSGVLYNLQFGSLFNLLGQNVFKMELGDIFAQTLEVITQDSAEANFDVYCSSIIPSAFYLNTQTTVIDINTIGEPKEVLVSSDDFVLNGDVYKATIYQLTHGQPVGNNYIVQGQYLISAGEYRSLSLDYSIDENGDITIYSESPLDLRVLIAAKMETQAMGILRLTNPESLEPIDYNEIGSIDITQTTTHVPLTLPDPAITNVDYKIFIFNNSSSTEIIEVGADGFSEEIEIGEGKQFIWVGGWTLIGSAFNTTDIWDNVNSQYLNETLEDLSEEVSKTGVAAGGTTGQVLRKKTATDYDTEWADALATSKQNGSWTGTVENKGDDINLKTNYTAIGGFVREHSISINGDISHTGENYDYIKLAVGGNTSGSEKLKELKITENAVTINDNEIEVNTNKVTSISSSSTDDEYPSAKCVYDIVGDIESLLAEV